MAPTSKPTDFRHLRDHLVQHHAAMPRRLQQIARYVLDHPDEVALDTVAAVSRRAGVQPSALVRFAQSLGYDGYSELQAVFRARLRERWPRHPARPAGEGRAATLLDEAMRTAAAALDRLRDTVAPQDLDSAADTLARADTIFLLGQRRAFPVAAHLSHVLPELGLPARLLDNVGGMLDEQARQPRSTDALLAVSLTPDTGGTIEAASAIARRGVPVVAITDSAFSPLVPLCAAWLEVANPEDGSLAAALTAALALAALVAEKKGS